MIVSPDLKSVEFNAILALGSGFFAAIAYLYVRKLRTTEHALSIVFWFAAFSVAFTLIPAAPKLPSLLSDPVLTMSLIGIGVGAGAGQVGSYICFSQGKCRLDKRFFISDCDYRYDLWLRYLWGKS